MKVSVISINNIFVLKVIILFILSNVLVVAQSSKQINLHYESQIIDSIEIIGNEDTKEFVILRELTFGIGDSVNTEMLYFNRERIFSLGIFTKVDLSIVHSNEKNVLQILIQESWYVFPVPFVNIREKTLDRTSYGVSLKYKNFRGRNETIRATASLGYDPFYSLEYENPLLIPSHEISFAFACALGTPINKSPKLELANKGNFDFNVFSIGAVFGKRLNMESNLYYIINHTSVETPSKEVIPFMASGTSVDNTLTSGFSLEYDSRNLKQFASSGMYLYINYLHNGFGISNISYNEMSFELRKYQKVYDEIVIKGRIHSKHVFGKYIPPYNLVRFGYDYYTRGERYIVSEGKNRFLGSVELSYPLLSEWNFAIDLPIIPKSLSRSRIAVHASIFADIGKVIDRPIDLKLKNFDSGYGAGITFLFLPYNSFRVEYAFNKMGEGELLIETGISF